MSKLIKFKKWLTLDEAADYLTMELQESVGKKDIYRLALDQHIRLSVNFVNHACARSCKRVAIDDVKWTELPDKFPFNIAKSVSKSDDPIMVPNCLPIDDKTFLDVDQKVVSLEGIWDLVMLGGEVLDIEHSFQNLTGGPGITLETIDGCFVERDGNLYQLVDSFDDNEFQIGSEAAGVALERDIQSKKIPEEEAQKLRNVHRKHREDYLKKRASSDRNNDYYPAGGLPPDSVLVVKTTILNEFLTSLDNSNNNPEKDLSTKERKTMLVLLAAALKEAGLDYKRRGIAVAISALTENLGAPVSDDTIRNILRQIDDALESRSK